ncbi:hypothetical protein JOE68_002284 [Saccharothrix algeriensis]|uniref:Basic proline-rich protein n=1 Tax=Saccharothrix algeriensis TaxID=173560 RepID=A0ABS2S5A8_9PSEU|nr:hypothetical protein [Saccharothrix algeriensis]
MSARRSAGSARPPTSGSTGSRAAPEGPRCGPRGAVPEDPGVPVGVALRATQGRVQPQRGRVVRGHLERARGPPPRSGPTVPTRTGPPAGAPPAARRAARRPTATPSRVAAPEPTTSPLPGTRRRALPRRRIPPSGHRDPRNARFPTLRGGEGFQRTGQDRRLRTARVIDVDPPPDRRNALLRTRPDHGARGGPERAPGRGTDHRGQRPGARRTGIARGQGAVRAPGEAAGRHCRHRPGGPPAPAGRASARSCPTSSAGSARASSSALVNGFL